MNIQILILSTHYVEIVVLVESVTNMLYREKLHTNKYRNIY